MGCECNDKHKSYSKDKKKSCGKHKSESKSQHSSGQKDKHKSYYKCCYYEKPKSCGCGHYYPRSWL